MNKENLNMAKSNSKPLDLDEYIQNIKSRNNKLSETVNDRVISPNEDLYNKILKESHNMRSEILTNNKNKINSTNVKFSDSSYNQDAASILFSRNINRALIFQSTENINKDSKNENENENSEKSELLSPIVKITDEKSGFDTLNKLCNGTETKILKNLNNSNQKISKEIKIAENILTNPNSVPLINPALNNYSRRINSINDKFSSCRKDLKLKNVPNPITPIDDFQILYLINNCKNIEKIIEDNRPNEKLEKIENKISKNFAHLDEMKRDELEIVEMKQEMEIKLQEVKNLSRMFEDKLASLEDFVSKNNNTGDECEKCKNKTNEEEQNQNKNSFSRENYTFDNYFKNNSMQIKRKIKFTNDDNKIISECSLQILKENFFQNKFYDEYQSNLNANDHCNKSQEDYSITNLNSNNISRSKNEKYENMNSSYDKREYTSNIHNSMMSNSKNIPQNNLEEISEKINYFLSKGMIKEATSCWKRINFMPLENCSFERSYEMLAQILKINERENEVMIRKNFSLEKHTEESKKKDKEIVHLFAQIELSRSRACEFEANCNELERVKSKLNNLINDNSTLYKENVKLKLLLKEAEYHSMKTNSETLFSTNNSFIIDNYYLNTNSKLKKENFH